MSVHGRQQNLIGAVRRNRKVFALVGEKDGIAKICDRLLSYGMDQVKLYVGERLPIRKSGSRRARQKA